MPSDALRWHETVDGGRCQDTDRTRQRAARASWGAYARLSIHLAYSYTVSQAGSYLGGSWVEIERGQLWESWACCKKTSLGLAPSLLAPALRSDKGCQSSIEQPSPPLLRISLSRLAGEDKGSKKKGKLWAAQQQQKAPLHIFTLLIVPFIEHQVLRPIPSRLQEQWTPQAFTTPHRTCELLVPVYSAQCVFCTKLSCKLNLQYVYCFTESGLVVTSAEKEASTLLFSHSASKSQFCNLKCCKVDSILP